MRRREFIAGLGGTAAWPLAARAQQAGRIPTIGYLGLTGVTVASEAFLSGLRDLGYVEGKNINIEFRFAQGDDARIPGLVAELVALNVDAIVTYATGVFAVQCATTTIPIVMAVGGDLVSMGVIASLARPGGNVTGSAFFYPELMAKRLELLKETVPSIITAGVLQLRDNPSNTLVNETMGAAAKTLNMKLLPIEVRGPAEFGSAFSTWADKQIGGLVVSDHGQILAKPDDIAALATKYRLPLIGAVELSASGGLLAYGVNFPELFRRAAVFVDKILKGTKPGEIPVEQASKFKLILNLKTAKALGLSVPNSILVRADEVIE